MHFLQKTVWTFWIINLIIFLGFMGFLIYQWAQENIKDNIKNQVVQITTPAKIIPHGENTPAIFEENQNSEEKFWIGTIISNTQIITAAHVVWNIWDSVTIRLPNKKDISATVEQVDPINDIALIGFSETLDFEIKEIKVWKIPRVGFSEKNYFFPQNIQLLDIKIANYFSTKSINKQEFSQLITIESPFITGESGTALFDENNNIIAIAILADEKNTYFSQLQYSDILK